MNVTILLDSPAVGARRLRRPISLTAGFLIFVAWSSGASAQTSRFLVDVVGSAGYASNPFIVDREAASSATFELAVLPRYTLADERGQVSVDGRYRRTQYLRRYDGSDDYGASVSATRELTEKLTANAGLQYDSSILGEQRGRSFAVEPILVVDGVQPVPFPTAPVGDRLPPDLIVDPGLIGLRQRQSQLATRAGLGYALSPVDRVSGQVSVSRLSYGGGDREIGPQVLNDFTTYGGGLGYARSLSERTRIGVQLSAQQTRYTRDALSSSVYQPQVTIDTRLNTFWTLSAAAGLLFIESRLDGRDDRATGLSGNANAVRTGERTNLSISAFRDAVASGFGGVSRIIGGSIGHAFRVNATDRIQTNLSVSRSEQAVALTANQPTGGSLTGGRSVTYGAANLSYDRRLTDRLNGGVAAGYRYTSGGLSDRPADVTAQVFLRIRLGDLR